MNSQPDPVSGHAFLGIPSNAYSHPAAPTRERRTILNLTRSLPPPFTSMHSEQRQRVGTPNAETVTMNAKNDLEKDPARPGRRVETRLRERNAFAWLAAAPSLGEWLGDLWPDLLTLIVVGAIVRFRPPIAAHDQLADPLPQGLGLNASDAIGGKSRYFMIFNENSEFVNYVRTWSWGTGRVRHR